MMRPWRRPSHAITCPPWTKGHKSPIGHNLCPPSRLILDGHWDLDSSGLPSTEDQATYIIRRSMMDIPSPSFKLMTLCIWKFLPASSPCCLASEIRLETHCQWTEVSLSGGGCHCFLWQSHAVEYKGSVLKRAIQSKCPQTLLNRFANFPKIVLQLPWVNETLDLRSETLDSSCLPAIII